MSKHRQSPCIRLRDGPPHATGDCGSQNKALPPSVTWGLSVEKGLWCSWAPRAACWAPKSALSPPMPGPPTLTGIKGSLQCLDVGGHP